jgi:acylglycerol lipase
MADFWVNTDTGPLYCRFWIPRKHVATLVCIHGVGEHIKRYDPLFHLLSQAGIRAGGFDQRGYGETVKKHGSKGHIVSEDVLFGDIMAVINNIRDATPLFLLGHSMGGGIALDFAKRNPSIFSGVIGSSPFLAFAPGSAPLFHERLALRLLPSIFPAFALPKHLDSSLLSNDPNVGKQYDSDPLVHSLISTLTAAQSIKRAEHLLADAPNFTLPILLVHGSNDLITGIDGTKQFHKSIASLDKTFVVFDGSRHEIHNEIEPAKTKLTNLYIDWILTRCSTISKL